MMFIEMRYQVLVKFDNLDCTDEERRMYYSVAFKYNALSFGDSKSRISELIITTNYELSEEILARDLNGLEILSFRINSLAKTKNLI